MNNRNIVLFVVDGLQKSHLYTYGYKRRNSTHLHKIKTTGAIFESLQPDNLDEKSLLNSLLTSTPARAREIGLKYNLTTLPEYLQENGYVTGAILDKKPILGDDFRSRFKFFYSPEDFGRPEELLPVKEIEGQAEKFIKNCGKQPFFLLVYISRFQNAFITKDKSAKKFLKDKLYKKKKVNLSKSEATFRYIPLSKQLGIENDLGKYIANYDAIIHEIDNSFGKIQDIISKQSLSPKTLSIFSGFRGINLGERNYFFSIGNHLYNEQIDLPLLARGPEIKFKTKVEGIARTIDIMPTILDYLKIKIPKQAFGISLLKALETKRTIKKGYTEIRETIAGNVPRKIIKETIRDERWKLIKTTELEIEYFPGWKVAFNIIFSKLFSNGFSGFIKEFKFQRNFSKNKKIIHSKSKDDIYFLEQDKKEKINVELNRPDKVKLYNELLEKEKQEIKTKVDELNSSNAPLIAKDEVIVKPVVKPKPVKKIDEKEFRKSMEVFDRVSKKMQAEAFKPIKLKEEKKEFEKKQEGAKETPETKEKVSEEKKEEKKQIKPEPLSLKNEIEQMKKESSENDLELRVEHKQDSSKNKMKDIMAIVKEERENTENDIDIVSSEDSLDDDISSLKSELESEIKSLDGKNKEEFNNSDTDAQKNDLENEIEAKLAKFKAMMDKKKSN